MRSGPRSWPAGPRSKRRASPGTTYGCSRSSPHSEPCARRRSPPSAAIRGESGSFVEFPLLVTTLGRMNVLELERLFVHLRRRAGSLVLPGCDVAEVFIVAQSLALRGLVLLPKMAAAGFVPLQRIE